MKFLCDEMLARLGRWLRAAGYDTAIATQASASTDRELLKQAIDETRILITRDRHFHEMKQAQAHIIYLSVNTLEECVAELGKEVPIDWLKNPFSRCLICNALLQKILDPSALPNFPKELIGQYEDFWWCSHCQKVYWQGSHTKRMLQQLQQWQG